MDNSELSRFCNRFKYKSIGEIVLTISDAVVKQPNDEFFAGVLTDNNLADRNAGYLVRAEKLVKALIENDSVAKEELAKILKQIEIGIEK
ncbi:hypothetical protein WIW50_02770 [Flavobacteriaceae bacterium 3-367]